MAFGISNTGSMVWGSWSRVRDLGFGFKVRASGFIVRV